MLFSPPSQKQLKNVVVKLRCLKNLVKKKISTVFSEGQSENVNSLIFFLNICYLKKINENKFPNQTDDHGTIRSAISCSAVWIWKFDGCLTRLYIHNLIDREVQWRSLSV